MDWKTYYQERHLTADEAVKHIKSGNRVLVTMHILLEHAPVMLSTAVAEISRLASFIRSLKLSIPLCRWM